MTDPISTPPDSAEKLAWLRLIRTENVGSATFWALLEEFGSAREAVNVLPRLARRGGRPDLRVPGQAEAEAEIEQAEKFGAALVVCGENGYPPLLAHIELPPPLIYLKGRADIWQHPTVAIVGARNASVAGMKFAGLLARALGERGLVVVSGLARGIDAAAHKAALGRGTVAVNAGGIDVVYPPENALLHAEICAEGAVITECPPGFQPRSRDFPRRNRIISGASLGVIVVEASERSGSLITARQAGDQGREVFAVPGHPLDPRAEGPNKLLKSGANLVTGADDVAEALAPILNNWPEYLSARDTQRAATAGRRGFLEDGSDYDGPGDPLDIVRNALQIAPVSIDDLIRATGLSARQVNVALLELELAGIARRQSRHLVSLRS